MIPHRMPKLIVDPLEMVDVEHDHRQLQAITLRPLQLALEPLLKIAPVVNPRQHIGDRQRAQLFLDAFRIGNIGQVAVPQGTAILTDFRRGLTAHPTQPGPRQDHPILLAPRRQMLGRVAHRAPHPLQVIRVDPLEHPRGILAQQLQVDFVDFVQPLAGVGEAGATIGVQAVLIDPARHLGTEFFQQLVTRRQRLMHPAPLGHIDADRQVADPQPLLVEHGRDQHVGKQLAAVLAHQGPLSRLAAGLPNRLGEQRLATGNVTPIAHTEGMRTLAQLVGLHQLGKVEAAHHFAGRVAEHALGAGIEGADHPLEAGGNDRHLGRRIEHAAQLVVGAAQGLFTDPQLGRALLDQLQRTLTLAEQAVEQGAEQQAQQPAQPHHPLGSR
ncbi:hypothetical protein PSRE111525_27710 [Pseudomonas reidholzensis]